MQRKRPSIRDQYRRPGSRFSSSGGFRRAGIGNRHKAFPVAFVAHMFSERERSLFFKATLQAVRKWGQTGEGVRTRREGICTPDQCAPSILGNVSRFGESGGRHCIQKKSSARGALLQNRQSSFRNEMGAVPNENGTEPATAFKYRAGDSISVSLVASLPTKCSQITPWITHRPSL
jgi:hypothetical protein